MVTAPVAVKIMDKKAVTEARYGLL